jgi:nitroreductase
MNTFTKIVMGAMGARRPPPDLGDAVDRIVLPKPSHATSMSLDAALARRRSEREFSSKALPLPLLGDLLWAADGVNRADGGRTAPCALGAHDVALYVALPEGAYRYEPDDHALVLAAAGDLRRITGYQDFVDEAPLDLVYVSDQGRLGMVSLLQRLPYAYVSAGAMAQNVYLACAARGIGCVIRAWIDREALAQALGLSHDQHVLVSQTVGYPLDGQAPPG